MTNLFSGDFFFFDCWLAVPFASTVLDVGVLDEETSATLVDPLAAVAAMEPVAVTAAPPPPDEAVVVTTDAAEELHDGVGVEIVDVL